MALATFGAGCFWGVEAAFRKIKGVINTSVGYTGGNFKSPTYRDVCTGQTGHAEVVQVEFDPETVSYDSLLLTFWKCHDPTQLNRQGPDIGTQYRSAIFYHDPAQAETARSSMEALGQSGRFPRPIVTRIVPLEKYYLAEEYHQQYLAKRGLDTCH